MSAKIQATFGTTKSLTCKTCGMTFHRHVPKDNAVHAKYHNDFLNGLPWKSGPEKLLEKVTLTVEKKALELGIVVIDAALVAMVKKVDKILDMVNCELNAPTANDAWKLRNNAKNNGTSTLLESPTSNSAPIPGRAFVLLALSRAIGLVVTEPIVDILAQSRWMVHRTQDVVPGQVNRNTKIGISRIWIAPKWRRRGLGRVLLRAVLKHSVFGMAIKPQEVAFSQPSYAGGLLAKSFNGVLHKSGEVLVPVYLEK